KRPEVPLRFGELVLSGLGNRRRDWGGIRPWRAHLHPGGNVGKLLLLELARGRHLDRPLILEDLDQPAVFGIALDRNGTALAALPKTGGSRQIELRHRLRQFAAVTAEALFRKYRPNPGLKKLDLFRRLS